MALIRIPDETDSSKTRKSEPASTNGTSIAERWTPSAALPAGVPADAFSTPHARSTRSRPRAAMSPPIAIDAHAETPNLTMGKFRSETARTRTKSSRIVEGRGLFSHPPAERSGFRDRVEAGDCIRVPRGTHHWFDLCGDKRIRAFDSFRMVRGGAPLTSERHRFGSSRCALDRPTFPWRR